MLISRFLGKLGDSLGFSMGFLEPQRRLLESCVARLWEVAFGARISLEVEKWVKDHPSTPRTAIEKNKCKQKENHK